MVGRGGPGAQNDLLGQILGRSEPSRASLFPPSEGVIQDWLPQVAEALRAGEDNLGRQMATVLDQSSLSVELAGDGTRSVRVFVTVNSSSLALARQGAGGVVRPELEMVARSCGWGIAELNFVAAAPPERPRTSPPKRLEFAAALVDAIYPIKSYDIASFCDRVGAPPHPNPDADPFHSKRGYVHGRVDTLDIDAMVAMAVRILEELDDPQLSAMVERCRTGGVAGTVKNVIFGSTNKPDLVLEDALVNNVALLNPEAALFYNDGIPEEGLSWRVLVNSLMPEEAATSALDAARSLHRRLAECLGSEPERLVFHTYAQRYREFGFDQPALLPQVWLHYDPRSARSRGGRPAVTRQRMDFLLLLPRRRRVVIEIDGNQHYSENGRPAPSLYAEMVKADRALRLAGYEVYRFGGAELPNQATAKTLLDPFFDELTASPANRSGS